MRDSGDQRQLYAGILLLGLGLIFLLANFGLGSWIGWDRWWPLILILIGLIIIFRREEWQAPPPPPTTAGGGPAGSGPSAPAPLGTTPATTAAPPRPRPLPLGGLILVGLGIAFLLRDVIGGDVFPALALIAVGGALLLRQWAHR